MDSKLRVYPSSKIIKDNKYMRYNVIWKIKFHIYFSVLKNLRDHDY